MQPPSSKHMAVPKYTAQLSTTCAGLHYCFLFWPNLLKCDPLVVLVGNTLGETFPETRPKTKSLVRIHPLRKTVPHKPIMHVVWCGECWWSTSKHAAQQAMLLRLQFLLLYCRAGLLCKMHLATFSTHACRLRSAGSASGEGGAAVL